MTGNVLTDEAFEMMKGVFERNNPELAADRTKMGEKLTELHVEIEKLTDERPEEWEAAVKILLQGRNFFARYLGEAEMEINFAEPVPEVPEIERKHVAVYVAGGGGDMNPLYLAVRKVLGLFKDALRHECYDSMEELIVALQRGEVCGIVALQLDCSASILSHIRHDLKNRPGWNYDRAQSFVLPPSADFSPLHDLIKVVETIKAMQDGKSRVSDPEGPLDPENLAALVSHMRVPSRQMAVSIVDDEAGMITGLVKVLEAWPNLKVRAHIHQGELPSDLDAQSDLLLLDEAMSRLTGTQFYKHLRDMGGFKGIAASISGGEKPGFTQWHFGGKALVDKHAKFARDFVEFMNRLITAAEKKK